MEESKTDRDLEVLLVLNGELPSSDCIQTLLENNPFVICADGATNCYRERSFTPNVVIGDLDSISEQIKNDLPIEVTIEERPSQYATDFEKALDFAEEKEASLIKIIGFKGGRFDHAFTNIAILAQNSERFLFEIHDDDGYGVVLNGKSREFSQEVKEETTVSLLPLADCHGVTTRGLLYPLSDSAMSIYGQLGQSNITNASKFGVSLEKGILLVYLLNATRH